MSKKKNENRDKSIKIEPGVISSYRHGWIHLWKKFLELFLIGLIAFIISSIGGWFAYPFKFFETGIPCDVIPYAIFYIIGGFLFTFSVIYNIMLSAPLDNGVAYSFLRAVRGEKLDVKHLFEIFKNYWNIVLANLLRSVIIGIGIVFLIVPGIILACKLAFVPYLVVDRKMNVTDSIRQSWKMTDGRAMDVFLIGLLSIPITIAGLLFFGVGVIISNMTIRAAFASLYYKVEISTEKD